ncbi:recombinase family protein [Mycobacterium sp.]|uniref:recombinase family protein n=1 Tax=Mycobacterium sp. TaxID=1785 RepID=UPI0031E0FD88
MSAPRRNRTAPEATAVGYLRVSTDEQVASGAGLEAQRSAIEAEAQRRGWTVVGWHADEGVSGSKGIDKRPGLAAAIEAIENRAAAALLVAKTDRVARSLRTLLAVVDRVERASGVVVAVDGTIDTSTAAGRFTTQIMGGVAELERALISDRTKAALAVRKAQGVKLGRASGLSEDVVARIVSEKASGASLRAIADGLNRDGIPTSRGHSTWYAPAVKVVVDSHAA